MKKYEAPELELTPMMASEAIAAASGIPEESDEFE